MLEIKPVTKRLPHEKSLANAAAAIYSNELRFVSC